MPGVGFHVLGEVREVGRRETGPDGGFQRAEFGERQIFVRVTEGSHASPGTRRREVALRREERKRPVGCRAVELVPADSHLLELVVEQDGVGLVGISLTEFLPQVLGEHRPHAEVIGARDQ